MRGGPTLEVLLGVSLVRTYSIFAQPRNQIRHHEKIQFLPTNTFSIVVFSSSAISVTHLIHVAKRVVAAAWGADGLPRPHVPIEPIEDHRERSPEPKGQHPVAVHPAPVFRNLRPRQPRGEGRVHRHGLLHAYHRRGSVSLLTPKS